MAKKKDLSTGMSERTSDIILVAICAVVLVIVAYPLYYVLVASFSDPYEVYAGCQRQFEIVRKRRRNFVVFRRGGG